MSLEFEKLTPDIDNMANALQRQMGKQNRVLAEVQALLDTYATAWDVIDGRIARAIHQSDEKYYRAALPLRRDEPLYAGVAPGRPPSVATIIASDGSQIVPDRHAPFLYYLINIGTITYYHGREQAPTVLTEPRLVYPGTHDTDDEDGFNVSSAIVGMRRDQLEIEILADRIGDTMKEPGPSLAILDQRLLYYPVGSQPGREQQSVVQAWQRAMTEVRRHGGWLAGYIDRPGKRSVVNMLFSMKIDEDGFKVSDLYRSDFVAGLTDTQLFDRVLASGERSPLFIDVSAHNNNFAGNDPQNEVCFFYLKTGTGGQELARVDIPRSVADDTEAVAAVHALLADQCRILGTYPYVITRADEIAVVGRRDQEELENRIALRLAERDMLPTATAKQLSKGYARATKTRYKD